MINSDILYYSQPVTNVNVFATRVDKYSDINSQNIYKYIL